MRVDRLWIGLGRSGRFAIPFYLFKASPYALRHSSITRHLDSFLTSWGRDR